ncbi:MAG: ABC transporter ATP-binding protein [Firmicutes bacterium]|nr:ABC transporter ATP-binding protein [Bacillota bacterium]
MGFGGHRGGGPRGMMMGPIVKPKNLTNTLKRLWRYMYYERKTLGIVFLLVALGAVLQLVGPYLIAIAIDDYILAGKLRELAYLCLLMIGIYLINIGSSWLQSFLMVGIAQRNVYNMRTDLFAKLQELPLKFFDNTTHGELMSRLTNDIDNVGNTLNSSTTQVISSVISLVGTLAMMIWLSPLLTALTLLVIPIMLFSTNALAKRTRTFFAEQQKNLGQLNGHIEEVISGQKVVKVFGREQSVIEKFNELNTRLKDSGIMAQIYSGIIPPLMGILNNLSFIIVAAGGGYLAVKGVLTIGVIAAFINYSRQFVRPLNELANQFNMFQMAIAGAERFFEILDEEPEPLDPPDAVELTSVKGAVRFENVDFAYEPDKPVLKEFNLDVQPGQTIALVGPTGAGKTTVINLLTRFYDIQSGKITIDGIDIRKIKRKNLRSQLGIVLQDTYLFSESVKENIRYGRLNATDEEVIEAAKLANADQFIRRLPNGYDTVLSEDGGDLSQGQRQLLAIARAILANPAILILDEATSNVDTRTEIHIQQAMLNLMKGRTSFVIAHRLSTIRNADKIVVINHGQIIEQGSHDELLEQNGFYASLYLGQFRQGIS